MSRDLLSQVELLLCEKHVALLVFDIEPIGPILGAAQRQTKLRQVLGDLRTDVGIREKAQFD